MRLTHPYTANVTVPLVIAVKALINSSKFIKELAVNVKQPVCDNTVPKVFKFTPPTLAV